MSLSLKSSNNSVDFLLAGATKAATSSIYEYFQRHPEVIAWPEDQPHYFSSGIFGHQYTGLEKEVGSLERYCELMPKGRPGAKIGDFDRLTLHGPKGPDLVKDANPNAKVLFILRNPIERAYSHYWMDIRECFENRSFLDAVREDYEQYSAGSAEYCPLIRLGFYAKNVQRFQEALGNDKVRVWLYDDFCAKPASVFKEMCEFIGVSFVPVPESGEPRENAAAVPKSELSAVLLRARRGKLRGIRSLYLKLPRRLRRYVKNTFLVKRIKVPAMPADARQFLTEIYKGDVLELERMLERDLSHWLRNPDNPLALPTEFKEQQKVKQAKFFDEAVDEEFEIERPYNCGALYEWSIGSKFERAVAMLSFPIAGSTLLDTCCGSGMGAEIYAKKGAVVSGIDISDRAISRARERARRHGFEAEFVAGDAEKLPYGDQSFDIVAVHDGLHHLPNPHTAIAEMARVARKAIIIIEPARSWLTRRAVSLRLALDYEEAGNYVYRFREGEVFEIARKHGLNRSSYQQYSLYYRHEPFGVARYFERTPILSAVTFGFDVMSKLAPRLGNKICVVCERTV